MGPNLVDVEQARKHNEARSVTDAAIPIRAPFTTVVRVIDKLSKSLGLTPRQTELLATIVEIKEIQIFELAQIFDLAESTMNKHLTKLYHKGWLSQHPDAGMTVTMPPEKRNILLERMQYHRSRVRYYVGRVLHSHMS